MVVKLGGTLLEDAETERALAADLAAAAAHCALLVVHGGGRQVTRQLAARGVTSHFVDGLRVSDEPVIDAVLEVIAGRINKRLVAAMQAAGARAFGLSGVDGGLTRAFPWDPALGAVGRPEQTDEAVLSLLSGAGLVPVVACVASGPNGKIFNVNADQMAISCAEGFQAGRLLFLTDVAGVRGSAGQTVSELTARDCHELIHAGIATGGMQAKLEAAVTALDRSTAEVWIASGRTPGVIGRFLAGEAAGTRIVRNEVGS